MEATLIAKVNLSLLLSYQNISENTTFHTDLEATFTISIIQGEWNCRFMEATLIAKVTLSLLLSYQNINENTTFHTDLERVIVKLSIPCKNS